MASGIIMVLSTITKGGNQMPCGTIIL